MKSCVVTLLFLLVSISCKDDSTRINKSKIIPREDFIEILVNIHLTDVMIAGSTNYKRYEPSDTVDIYGSIFEKYGITKSEFDTTVAMYTRQPDVYIKVYDEVLLKLNYRLDTLKNNIPRFSGVAIEE